MADVHFQCSGCGRIGTVDDGFSEAGDPCQDEECGGVMSIVEVERVRLLANALHEFDGDGPTTEDEVAAIVTAELVLRSLANIYEDHKLWDTYGSSGADDAEALYNVLNAIGLEVA